MLSTEGCCCCFFFSPSERKGLLRHTVDNKVSASAGVGMKPVEFRDNVRISPGTKKTVRNNEVSALSGCP